MLNDVHDTYTYEANEKNRTPLKSHLDLIYKNFYIIVTVHVSLNTPPFSPPLKSLFLAYQHQVLAQSFYFVYAVLQALGGFKTSNAKKEIFSLTKEDN